MLFLSLLILGLWVGCLYALTAIGLVLVRATSGFVNFAHGAVVVAAAYAAYATMKWMGSGVAVGILMGLGIACVLALAFELFVYRPLRRSGAPPLVLMIASLGLFVLVENALVLLFGDQTLVLPFERSRTVVAFGTHLTVTQIGSIIASALLFASIAILFLTKLGIKTRAVADDSELAALYGVDTNRVITWVTVVAGTTGAAAGLLWSCDNDLSPAMGLQVLLYGLVAATVGGFRGITSAALGGIFIGLIQYVGIWKLPTQWQDAIVFVILALFLILRPQGFLGKPLKKADV